MFQFFRYKQIAIDVKKFRWIKSLMIEITTYTCNEYFSEFTIVIFRLRIFESFISIISFSFLIEEAAFILKLNNESIIWRDSDWQLNEIILRYCVLPADVADKLPLYNSRIKINFNMNSLSIKTTINIKLV
jgi:hypothetical protein